MVFTLDKFTLYLSAYKFVFYVYHMVIVYLMNKTHVSKWISRLLLFFEYDSL
jgi:hypothetical protein